MEIKYIEYGTKEYEENVKLRVDVLRRPLNCDMDEEERAFEKEGAPIVGLYDQGKMVGAGVMGFVDEEQIEIKYMAVSEEMRGKGVGNAIMDELEDYAKRKGLKKVVLVARTGVLPFYEKRNYITIGEAYEPGFVPVMHIRMEKELKEKYGEVSGSDRF